jgi:ABC-type branched-subunit amino acid transport system substrate-binding protein
MMKLGIYRIDKVASIGLFLAPSQIKAFIEQARAQRYTPHYFGIDTFNDSSISELFLEDAEGPVIVDAFSDPDFVDTYQKRFGETSRIVEAARGHLLAQLLIHISTAVGESSGAEKIAKAIDSFPPAQGESLLSF